MEYFFWALGIALLVLIIIKYRGAKTKHQAAANVVFAKYTFEKLSEADQARVKEKAQSITSNSLEDEITRFAWYAIAMNELGIPSSIPDNPKWYQTKTPDVLLPNEFMIKAVVTFINRNYGLDIEVAGIGSFKKEEPKDEEKEARPQE